MMEQLLVITPLTEMQMYHLGWEPRVLDTPFYDGKERDMEKANSFSNRLNALCCHAHYLGLQQPMTSEPRAFISFVNPPLSPGISFFLFDFLLPL